MQNETKHDSTKGPAINDIQALTRNAVDRQNRVEIAGFLTREDDNSLYVADPQGTWVISREDVLFVEDWNADGTPYYMHSAGRPVRVGIRDGCTIHEIRPWRIAKTDGALGGPDIRKAIEKIFTLGGAALPISERTIIGENQLADLERMFARRCGWNPDDPRADPRGGFFRSSVSKTIEIYNGYTDTDEPF